MNRQQNTTLDADSPTTGDWMGLMNSVIGFTSAATMFTIQQFENAMTLDSRKMVRNFQRAIDSLSHAMTSEVDHSKRSTADQINKAGARVVDATVDSMTRDNIEFGNGSPHPEEPLSGRKR